jgi:hypothetical protein
MAIKQLLISPGGRIPNSFLIRPELPPSSATVTMAVKLLVSLFKPRRIVPSPVPPPITTILTSFSNNFNKPLFSVTTRENKGGSLEGSTSKSMSKINPKTSKKPPNKKLRFIVDKLTNNPDIPKPNARVILLMKRSFKKRRGMIISP